MQSFAGLDIYMLGTTYTVKPVSGSLLPRISPIPFNKEVTNSSNVAIKRRSDEYDKDYTPLLWYFRV